MSTGDSSSSIPTITPLNDSGVDFSNYTQAFNFQQEILDDSILKIIASQYAKNFWYGILVVIGIATMFNVIQKSLLRMRIRAAAANKTRPAGTETALTKTLNGVMAVCRRTTYPQFSPAGTFGWLRVPPLGIILLLLSYLGFVLALEFTDDNIDGAQHYQALGIRAGWLAVSQIPLLLLLSGKVNLIGALVGVSYERLNVLHRWVSRSILLCTTLHFAYQGFGWNLYGLMQLEFEMDTCATTGMVAYALLLWLNLSTLAPIRNRFYEVFIIQHIISSIAFIYLVLAHLNTTAAWYTWTYVSIGVGIYFLDRLIRTLRYAYNNIRPGRASLIVLEGGVTLVRVQSQQVKSWAPGSHVFLSIPRLGFGQSHPATIASTPSSHGGDLVFILKAHKGFTHRIRKSATTSKTMQLSKSERLDDASGSSHDKMYIALVGGPYSASNSDPAAFDTVLFISGSTGVTFTISNLLSLAQRAQTSRRLPLRRVDFVWVVKKVGWTTWIADEVTTAVCDLKESGIEVNVTICVTSNDGFYHLPAAGTAESAWKGSAAEKYVHPNGTISIASSVTQVEVSKTTISATEVAEKQQLPFAEFICGRPDMSQLVRMLANQAEGETGIFACGPLGLCSEMRRTVAREGALRMGTGAGGIYLHVENFGW